MAKKSKSPIADKARKDPSSPVKPFGVKSMEDIKEMTEGKKDTETPWCKLPDESFSAPEKLKNKSYEEITAVSVIDVPRNHLKPVNQRIFCVKVDPGEQKTESGIILATSYGNDESKGKKVKKFRYFVIDVAVDCTVEFIDHKDNKRTLRRGDEIAPFIPEDMISYSHTLVHDFGNNEIYVSFHQTEIAGVNKKPLFDPKIEEE
jgi:co-chaperonin GroES (HSP10)